MSVSTTPLLIQHEKETFSRSQIHDYLKIASKAKGYTPDFVVDMRSDTITLSGMREALADAIVGDDVMEEDPTTKELERRFAQILQKEDALLVTSGTQGNLISEQVHCNVRGYEIICGDKSHMFVSEQVNGAQFGRIQSAQISNEPDGTFSLQKLKIMLRSDDIYYPVC